MKIFESAICNDLDGSDLNIGDIVIYKHRMVVKCDDGLLEIKELQLAGKKRMETNAFLLGFNPKKLH